jgi:subtilisin family serine protease
MRPRLLTERPAGPKDPSLERTLKAAYDKGIVLIAAAGNARAEVSAVAVTAITLGSAPG